MVFLDLADVKPLVSRVVVDYAKGIGEAIRHLVSLGHERIGFISGPLMLKSARTRRSAFSGLSQEIRRSALPADRGRRQPPRRWRRLCDARDAGATKSPTAVMTSNDLTAIGALRAIAAAVSMFRETFPSLASTISN